MKNNEFLENAKYADKEFKFHSLPKVSSKYNFDLESMPYSLRILLENLVRNFDDRIVDEELINKFIFNKEEKFEIPFRPSRVVLQDFTGVPCVADLAAMRDVINRLGGDTSSINPLVPVDLVIDHSVQVDYFREENALSLNTKLEFDRNQERYSFLRWAQTAFENFRAVPPGNGIVHQVNLEYLAKLVQKVNHDSGEVCIPDTLVGTDSHTTMINGISVLGWGVGGIEAEAAMLGQPLYFLIPDVIGFKLEGNLCEGVTATDLVLNITEMLRTEGVVGKFVEFYGPGLDNLPLPDRATIANMAPEYGATMGFFPVDQEALNYLKLTGRTSDEVKLVESYYKAQNSFRDSSSKDPEYYKSLYLNLESVKPALAGPKRPQDRILLSEMKSALHKELKLREINNNKNFKIKDSSDSLKNGSVVLAAITSCTNTSNPYVMVTAGLVAKKARDLGLKVPSYVKTSLAPGSKVVVDYLENAGLLESLSQIGFKTVGFGCTTCIGNSGPLPLEVGDVIVENSLHVAAVSSGNRNFEGRVHPLIRLSYLGSPPLVVAYALAGTVDIDFYNEKIGTSSKGDDIYLKDIWPSNEEIRETVYSSIHPDTFVNRYSNIFIGDDRWESISVPEGSIYDWDDTSTYIQKPGFFDDFSIDLPEISDIKKARVLAYLGDSITTDHISPAGSFTEETPAGKYLKEREVELKDFNSYGSRRGNHEVMMRGTFANIRIKNKLLDNVEGGFTKLFDTNETMAIYDAAIKYKESKTDLIVIAGKEYGTGSSRDWAAKGSMLLGVKAVIAESFERIHRSNLVGMGVLPLQFMENEDAAKHKINGNEKFSIAGISSGLTPLSKVKLNIEDENGKTREIDLVCRLDSVVEVDYFYNGGILQTVLRQMQKTN
ncbi:aconitate hydratase AcnA [bacterium]|jgi:aconitate hydratase|nr:aconitate hydratase AcnA [bacterium]MBT3849996.1 aconitate hydratase AcnA [bacterium]